MRTPCSLHTAAAILLACGTAATAQVATMPPHSSNFNGSTRGYYFTAPVDFRITGLRVLQEPGGNHGYMNWAVVRFDNQVPPPVFSATTNDFVQLDVGLDQDATNFAPANIEIFAGDVIGIYGNTMEFAGASSGRNSYTASTAQATTTVLGFPIDLVRSGMQFHLGSGGSPQMHDIWGQTTLAVTRVEFTYESLGPQVPAACCFSDGSCQNLLAQDCFAQGGSFQGSGTDCATTPCPQPGACCFADGTCQELLEAACAAGEGVWHGAGTNCGTISCPQPGACCVPQGCTEILESECIASGGQFEGENIPCPASCTIPLTVVIPPDNAAVAGSGAITTMFNSGARTYQHTLPGADLAAAPGDALVGFTTRTRVTSVNAWPSQNVTYDNFDVYIGELALPLGPLSTTFADNVIPGTEVQVRSGPMTVPAESFVSEGVLPNLWGTFVVAFDTPFEFDPSKDYVITVRHTGNGTSSQGMDRIARSGAYHAMSTSDYTAATGSAANYTIHQFYIGTSGTPCYADCDNNETLNIDDFLCFINEFSQAQMLPTAQQISHYANCTGSTSIPVLTIDDFLCFINEFSQGCP